MTLPAAQTAPPSMRTRVLHQLRFDMRRYRGLVAAMVGLELSRAAFEEWTLHVAPVAIGERFGGVSGQPELDLIDAALTLGLWLTTAMLTQGDHPSDDRAFWRTRPIPPHVMALTKLTLLSAVFVVVPAAVNAARLIAYGAPASSVFAATLQIATTAGLAIVPAWTLAVLTRTLPGFLAACLGGIVALYLALNAYVHLMVGRGGVGSWGVSWEDAAETHGWAVGLATALVAIAILVAHYRVRRPVVAACAGIAVVLGPTLVPAGAMTHAAPPALAEAVAGRLALTSGLSVPDASRLREQAAGGSGLPAFIEAHVAVPPLAADISAGVVIREPRLHVGGRVIAGTGMLQCCAGRGAAAVVSAEDPPPRPGEPPKSWPFGAIPAPDADAIRGRLVDVEAGATVVFVRHRLVASLPFRRGAAFRSDDYLVEVLAVEDRRGVALVRVARFPTLRASGDPHVTFFESDAARSHVGTIPSPYPLSAGPMGDAGAAWSQGSRWAVRLHLPIRRTYAPLPDPRLLIVESRRVGETTTTLTARDVAVSSPAQ